MSPVSEGQAAIAAVNGKPLKDRPLTVNAARPRSDDRGGSMVPGEAVDLIEEGIEDSKLSTDSILLNTQKIY